VSDVDPGRPEESTAPSPDSAAPPREARSPRNRTIRFAWAAVVVIIVGVVGLVVYALTRPTVTPQTVTRSLTAPGVVSSLAKVPTKVFDTVGISSPLAVLQPPSIVTSQPALASGGKPEVLFVGAEFCPFCGSERWPLIVALSRFGHFENLANMQSSANSVFPSLQTFTFYGTGYVSPYVTFNGIELYSATTNAHGVYTRIARLSPAEAAVVARYGKAGRTQPFVDIDNETVATTSGFSPAVLVGQSQGQIAGDVSQPTTATGQAIVATANYLTAGICQATHQRPASVCSSKGVRAAATALGLS
jgi:Domain of unknown function (DUF929)